MKKRKIFVSQPTGGKTPGEIEAKKKSLIEKYLRFDGIVREDQVEAIGPSIGDLLEADVMIVSKDWEEGSKLLLAERCYCSASKIPAFDEEALEPATQEGGE
jgi:hypothetical protein